MTTLSSRVTRLQPSATLAMSQKSAELKAQGIDIINLSVGEPDFDTPEHIRIAAQKAIDEGKTRYTPVPGIPALRQAIVEKMRNENGLEYTAEQIIVSNGAKQSVCNTLLALCNEGDEVIIPAPYWVSYPQMALMADATPVIVEAGIEQDFKITPQQLEATITPRTKAFILCTPSNPTGAVYTADELEALAEVLRRHEQVVVIADEIYEHINYTGQHASIAACEGMKERTVVVNGVSKAYAMTGWRIGFIAAPLDIAKATQKLQGQYTSNPGSVSQYAALAAYEGSQQCVEEMRQAFARRKDLIVELAREIAAFEVNEPMGAFYLFPKCSSLFGKSFNGRTINNSTDFALYLLEEAHVATVGGDAFGSPECFRMSYATSDDTIREALKRIKQAVEQLQ
ncbi:MAG: pyridoxal phosphate-dependent aminotransferase [Bacteroidaceae bacterium]|nr:pyridoxal phosphate-dependent aminotransferase [Bacteroidaceae bacterium]